MNNPGPEMPESQIARSVRYDLVIRQVRVSAIKQVTPRIRRVQVHGPELEGFITSAFDDHVKVFFPNEQGEMNLPTVENGKLTKPKRGRPAQRRDYTPINYDPEKLTLEFDFALHEGTGVANHWAGQAQVGQELAIAGPRGSKLLPPGFDHYVFGGDEAAFPALSRAMDHMRTLNKPAKFLLQTHSNAEESYFAAHLDDGKTDIEFVSAGQGGRGLTGSEASQGSGKTGGAVEAGTSSLLQALQAHLETVAVSGGYYWFAGEARGLQPLRRHLRQDLSLDLRQVAVDGYWKLGKADHDHHEPIDPKDRS